MCVWEIYSHLIPKELMPLECRDRQRIALDNACKQILIDCGKDWKKLPEGPLKKAFEKAQAKIKNSQI
jgi:hypothetical protein